MTKEKWLEIRNKEARIYFQSIIGIPIDPENWGKLKDSYLKFIESIDEATEVYNMENSKGKV